MDHARTPVDRASERPTTRRADEGRTSGSLAGHEEGSGRAQKSALVPPEGQVFPVAVLVVVSSSSRRSPTHARGVRNAGAKWLNSELTRRSEINVGLPACHSTRRSSALILLLHNNNRLISRALTSKRGGEMRRSERHLSSMR